MSKNFKITLMAIVIVILGNAIANANEDKHDKIRVIPIENSNWNYVYNYSKCWTHYVYGETKQETINNYFSNTRSIGYNQLDCITEGEDL
jgi:hypothetical protein